MLQPAEGEREIPRVLSTKGDAKVLAGAEDLVLCFRRAEGVKELRKMPIYLFQKNSAEPSRKKPPAGAKPAYVYVVLPIQRVDVPREMGFGEWQCRPQLRRWNWAWQLSPNGSIKGKKVVVARRSIARPID